MHRLCIIDARICRFATLQNAGHIHLSFQRHAEGRKGRRRTCADCRHVAHPAARRRHACCDAHQEQRQQGSAARPRAGPWACARQQRRDARGPAADLCRRRSFRRTSSADADGSAAAGSVAAGVCCQLCPANAARRRRRRGAGIDASAAGARPRPHVLVRLCSSSSKWAAAARPHFLLRKRRRTRWAAGGDGCDDDDDDECGGDDVVGRRPSICGGRLAPSRLAAPSAAV